MGRVYVAQVDMGFGVSVEDIVRQGIKYMDRSSQFPSERANAATPTFPPAVSSLMSMDHMAMDDGDTMNERTNQNRRRSFGYDNIYNDDYGDDYEGDSHYNQYTASINDRDDDMTMANMMGSR